MRYANKIPIVKLTETGKIIPVNIEDDSRTVDGCFATDLLSHAIGNAKSGDAWLTVLTNPNITAPASIADVSCIVVCDAVEPTENLRQKCGIMGISLFKTELPVTDAAVYLYRLSESMLS